MRGKAHDIVIMRTCYALAKAGHNIKVITGRPDRGGSIFEYYGIKPMPQFEVIQVPMLRGTPFSWHAVFNFFCLLKILELKNKGAADLIYLREIKLSRFFLKFKKILKIPVVIEVHDLKVKKFYSSCPEYNKDERYVFHRVDGIIVLLNTFASILQETYNIDGVLVAKVPLASEKTGFSYAQSGRKIIGYIGQLYPMQGVDILVEAMTYLPEARLNIIGGGERDLKRLKKLALEKKISDRVDFLGFVAPHEVPERAKEADVMVICALNSGKRRYSAHTKLYEYMAMGKPIVAVDIPSISEEVTNGKDALLARPEDPEDLAKKIREVLDNPGLAETLALNAYKAADEFSWEKRALRLSEFFRKVNIAYYG